MINWICFLFLGTFGWGISIYLMKILVVSLSPVEIVLYRMMIGAVSLLLLATVRNLRINNIKGLLIDGIVVGTLNMSVPFYLTTYAVRNVSSSLASIMNGLTPFFTLVLGIFLFNSNKSPTIMNVLSIICGFFGIVIINIDFSLQGSKMDLIALLLTCVSYGITVNYFKHYSKTKDPILVATMSAFISALTMLVIKMNMDATQWNLPHSGKQMMALLWLGAVGSGLCLYLYFWLIKNAGTVFASMVTYLMTLTGVMMGVILLDEIFSTVDIFGCMLILTSLFLINHASQIESFYKSLKESLAERFVPQ